jgi:hypothetical protein
MARVLFHTGIVAGTGDERYGKEMRLCSHFALTERNWEGLKGIGRDCQRLKLLGYLGKTLFLLAVSSPSHGGVPL